jgi:hypothetical protein
LRNKQVTIDGRQATLDDWLNDRIGDKLRKASIIVSRTRMPFVLYRNIIEEGEHVVQEEVATINEKYVVIEVLTYGGFLPISFQQQCVFTLYEFPTWIMKRSRDLFLTCIKNLDEQLGQ